jgi:hypothetical protein
MPDKIISFNGDTVGLVVRGKQGPKHHPGPLSQHADCVLSDGNPVGFYGETSASKALSGAFSGAVASGVVVGSTFGPMGSASGAVAGGLLGGNTAKGMTAKGAVWYYEELRRERLLYVDIETAVAYGQVSTVLLVKVTMNQALLFNNYWLNLDDSPGTFRILGGNCSTHASDGFMAARILKNGIPGLDTPDNLYDQLAAAYPNSVSVTGYIGFARTPFGSPNKFGTGFNMIVRPLA